MSALRKSAGIICIILGVLSLLTPLTPGAWLIIVGLGILGVEVAIEEDHWLAVWAKRLGFRLKKKKKPEPVSTDSSSEA